MFAGRTDLQALLALLLCASSVSSAPQGAVDAPTLPTLAPDALAGKTTGDLPQLPPVLDGIAENVVNTSGFGRGCVVLEAVDVRCALDTINIDAAFLQYRKRVREAIEPVMVEVASVEASDPESRADALDAIHDKHIARVRAAVDAAQSEMLTALGADDAARYRMLRHALWRPAKDGSDLVGFDVGMLYEDDAEPTSKKLRGVIGAKPEAEEQVRELLAAHNARVGPIRESSVIVHRAVFAPGKAQDSTGRTKIAKSLAGIRESNETVIDEISRLAQECGAELEALEWRARVYRFRGERLFSSSDLLDTFRAALGEGDALDAHAMGQAQRDALVQRDAAMKELLGSSMKCRELLAREGPNSQGANRMLANFSNAADKWEKCERKIGEVLKGQLREQASSAGLAIDRYLAQQDRLASEHWRDQLQFLTAFVQDQRSPK